MIAHVAWRLSRRAAVNLWRAPVLSLVAEELNVSIADVHALEAGGCTSICWVSLKKMYAGHVDQVAFVPEVVDVGPEHDLHGELPAKFG